MEGAFQGMKFGKLLLLSDSQAPIAAVVTAGRIGNVNTGILEIVMERISEGTTACTV